MEPIEFDRSLSSLLSEDDPLRVRFERWRRFLQRELTFSHSESVCHTTEHVERVLLFALLLGRLREVSSDDLVALALCAGFHDLSNYPFSISSRSKFPFIIIFAIAVYSFAISLLGACSTTAKPS